MTKTINCVIDLQNAINATNLPSENEFQQWAELALIHATTLLASQAHDQVEICIRIIDEKESRHLNSTYRKKDKPTNVLSFPYDEDELLGDIAICASIVEQESLDQNKPALAHWAHLVIHGVLHLLGFDHNNDKEADIMEKLEIDILHELGIPNPYQIEDNNDR